MMLNTVDEELRTIANSIANIGYNMFGFLPAPYIYGLIADYGGGNNKIIAMRFLMSLPVISVIFYGMAAYYLLRDGFATKE